MKFRKSIFGHGGLLGSGFGRGQGRRMALEVDIGPSYNVKEKKGTFVLRIGGDGGSIDNDNGGYGCFALVRFAMTKGKKV